MHDLINTIICGDCLEVMRDWPDNCVDLVLTDPPYGVGKASWDSVFPDIAVWQEVKRIMKTGASIVIYPGEANIPEKINLLNSVYDYQWLWVWYKPNAMQFGKTGYSVQSIAWWFSKGKATTKSKIRDVIVCPIIPAENDFGHPTPKPIGCIYPIAEALTKEEDIVLDPFCGSGTTCVAAKMLGRRYIGIDISPEYCEIARKRIEAADKGITVKELDRGQGVLF